MSRSARLKLITDLEHIRKSRVVCYITGDRQGLETKIGMDVFPLFDDLLNKIGKVDRLDLYLYSPGGLTMAGWGLVNVLREYCKRFSVLIPFKAHSAATLIALGADEIVMGKLGQLSPIDPSIHSAFNPQVQGKFLPLSVEDVVGFLDLARKEAKLSQEDSLRVAFEKLATSVHPMALGSVYRVREQIGMLARKLLAFHMKGSQKTKIDNIVSILTKDRYSHDYLISRREAKQEIGLKVLDPIDEELEKLLMALLCEYSSACDLPSPYSPETILGQNNEATVTLQRAFLESRDGAYVFMTSRHVKRVMVPQPGVPVPVEGFQERNLKEGWEPLTE